MSVSNIDLIIRHGMPQTGYSVTCLRTAADDSWRKVISKKPEICAITITAENVESQPGRAAHLHDQRSGAWRYGVATNGRFDFVS